MFQFPGFPALTYVFSHTLHGSSPWGFPHSEICGSMLIYSSPQLIAACHVLLRLPVPRHSPYALVRLNFLQSFLCCSLDLLNCLSFIKQIILFGCQFSVKRFYPFCFESFFPPFGEIVIYPNLERPSDFFANLLVLNLCVLLSVRFLLFNTLFGFQ